MTEAPPQYLQQVPSDVLCALARTPSCDWHRRWQRPVPNDHKLEFNAATGGIEDAPSYKFEDCTASQALADPNGRVAMELSITSSTGVTFQFVTVERLAGNGEPWTRLWEMIANHQSDAAEVLLERGE